MRDRILESPREHHCQTPRRNRPVWPPYELPILEETDYDFKSEHTGYMHACGHDFHMTIALGILAYFVEKPIADHILFLFQPAEEGPGGAELMLNSKIAKEWRPDIITALHIAPELPVGTISTKSGLLFANTSELFIDLKGKGGHAASPHLCVDPILIASHLIIALQQVISRNSNPFDPSVLSITSFQGGATTNVIPNEIKLMGTFRAMNEKWRAEAHQLIERISKDLVHSMGGEIDLHIDKGYPAVINNEDLNKSVKIAASEFLGSENVEETELRMGAEDFGYYAQKIPACFYRVGVMNKEKGIVSGVHTPTFNIDEKAIEVGMGLMAWLGTCI